MSLIEVIPIGKKYRDNRENLMYKAKIFNVAEFKEELTKLRKKYIIIFDDGYYLPSSKEEYLDFIKKMNSQMFEISNKIEMAYKEMEEKENV